MTKLEAIKELIASKRRLSHEHVRWLLSLCEAQHAALRVDECPSICGSLSKGHMPSCERGIALALYAETEEA